jgi:hypothetical protein
MTGRRPIARGRAKQLEQLAINLVPLDLFCTRQIRCSGLIGILQRTSFELTQERSGAVSRFRTRPCRHPLTDIITDLSGTLPADYAALLPIAADVALVPFALFLGLGPTADAVEGTLLNITGLIP